ncbi:hypothetical protein JM946_20565 [Steroidobacter sp. S1-65]|uniref:MobA/VirD2-like nuclease domain-containing protein n=1 Tax=Steroidobacter gossypii TaxID=2805490 RepID=A0ABS1X1R7_9GAMM|nr:hypothetical protein [Steroidobacter gossypii]MBM0107136.1 hypothetical protein [Steroidobacter gossypii]
MKPFRIRGDAPLFDIGGYARRGPGGRSSFSAAEIEQISRTVRRAPEVMVKVTGGASVRTSRGVKTHFSYISRAGELEIETDHGERLLGHDAPQRLFEDWDLDLEKHRPRAGLYVSYPRKPPKLVRNITFSMPAGTPPAKVHAAVRDFARDQLGRRHRYAMVLHTNEPHPHVHLTVKAVSEGGVRLDIRRATLRQWRQQFARQLRAQGVEANATERRIRGQSRAPKLDGIFRAARRGESSHMAARVREVVRELKAGALDESGAERLRRSRLEVVRGWTAVRDLLIAEGRHELADQVSRFIQQMPPPRTEKQWLAAELLARARGPRAKEQTLVR